MKLELHLMCACVCRGDKRNKKMQRNRNNPGCMSQTMQNMMGIYRIHENWYIILFAVVIVVHSDTFDF